MMQIDIKLAIQGLFDRSAALVPFFSHVVNLLQYCPFLSMQVCTSSETRCYATGAHVYYPCIVHVLRITDFQGKFFTPLITRVKFASGWDVGHF